MTLSQEYLAAVSTLIMFGQQEKATVFNYYYYYGSTFTTFPPTGVVAVLKYNGSVVATLQGFQTSISTSSVTFLFYDTSENTYSFNEVDIYTQNNGTLQYLVSKNTGLNYTKSNDEVVTIYFTLTVENTPSIFVNYSFLYLLVPNLIQQNVFPFTVYDGITSVIISGITGSIEITGFGIIPNGFVLFGQLTTTGGGTPTIIAQTIPTTQQQRSQPQLTQVFTATLNVSLPQTSTQATYPIAFGLTYEVG